MTDYILESVNGYIPEELEEDVNNLNKELNRKYSGCPDNSYYKELIEYDIALFNKQVEENHPHLNFKLRIKKETPETMSRCEKEQLLDCLNDYYETRDKIVLTANEYVIIFRVIDENQDKDIRELIPLLISEIDEYRKIYMEFLFES